MSGRQRWSARTCCSPRPTSLPWPRNNSGVTSAPPTTPRAAGSTRCARRTASLTTRVWEPGFASSPPPAPPPTRLVQTVEISNSPGAAKDAYRTTIGWFAGCAVARLQLVRAYRVSGVGNEAQILRLRIPARQPRSYLVGAARTGALTVSTLLETTGEPKQADRCAGAYFGNRGARSVRLEGGRSVRHHPTKRPDAASALWRSGWHVGDRRSATDREPEPPLGGHRPRAPAPTRPPPPATTRTSSGKGRPSR